MARSLEEPARAAPSVAACSGQHDFTESGSPPRLLGTVTPFAERDASTAEAATREPERSWTASSGRLRSTA